MAGLALMVSSGEVSLTAATAKTVLQIKAPTNQRVRIKTIRVTGEGIVVTDKPIFSRLTRSSANFGTGTSATPGKINTSNGETIQSSCAKNFTVEPTSPSATGYEVNSHPQNGFMEQFQFDSPLEIAGGNSINVECTAAQAQTVVCSITFEE
jgi:hypothetical protein